MAKLKLGDLYERLNNKAVNKRRKENEKYIGQKARAEQANRHKESTETNKRLASSSGSRKAVGLAKGFASGFSFVPIREDKNESFGDYRYKQYAPKAASELSASVNQDRARQQNLLNKFEDYKAANTVGNIGGAITGAMMTSGATRALAGKAMNTHAVRKLTDKSARLLARNVTEKAAEKSAARSALRKAMARAAQNSGLEVTNGNITRMAHNAVKGLSANVLQDMAYDTTFGAAKDISRYVEAGGNPLEDKGDFAKYMLQNAGTNLVYGAIGNAILPAARRLKRGKQYFKEVETPDVVPNRSGDYGTHMEKVPVPLRQTQQAEALKDADYMDYIKKNGINGKNVAKVAREEGRSILDVVTDNYTPAIKKQIAATKQAAKVLKQTADADSVVEGAQSTAKAANVQPSKELSANATKAPEYTPYMNEYAIGPKYNTPYIMDSESKLTDLLPGWNHMTADQYLKKYTVEGDAIEYAKKHNMTPSDARNWAKDRIAEMRGYRKLTDDELTAAKANIEPPRPEAMPKTLDETMKKTTAQGTPVNIPQSAKEAEQQAVSATKQATPATADAGMAKAVKDQINLNDIPEIRQHTVKTNVESKATKTITQFAKRHDKEIGKKLDDWFSDTESGKRFTETHPEAIDNATKYINEYGEDGTYAALKSHVDDMNAMTNEEIAASGELMIKWIDDAAEATRNGNTELAKQIQDKIDNLAAVTKVGLSNSGRGLEAGKMLQRATPEGRARTVYLTATQLKKRYGIDKLTPNVELVDMLKKARSEKDINEIEQAIAVDTWNQIPGSANEKFGAWRYLSMLMNPRTHIRNMAGNAAFTPIRGVRNTFEGVLQKAFSKKIQKLGGTQTKTIVNPLSKTYKNNLQGGLEQWDGRKAGFYANNTKLTLGLNRAEGSAPFKNSLASGLYKANSNLLNVEDEWCAAPAFQKSFANYLEANHIDYAHATKEQIDAASEVAYRDALEATYRTKNALAEELNKIRKSAYLSKEDIAKLDKELQTGAKIRKGAGIALDTMAPFTNTPANIMKTGAVDFNPAQMFRGVYHIVDAGKKSDAGELLDGIRQVSDGVTGTGLYMLGAWLAHKGIATASIDGDSEGYYKRDKGYQDYSFTIGNMKLKAADLLDLLSLGKIPKTEGKTNITMDWAMPAALPLFMGVEAYAAITDANKTLKAEAAESGNDPRMDEKVIRSLGNYVTRLPKMVDPVFQMSLLSSFSNVLDTSDAKKNGVSNEAQIALNLVDSRSGQYVPTALGQISRTAASGRHNTTSTRSGMPGWVGSFARRQVDKIPVVGGIVNPDKSDAFGNTVKGKSSAGDYVKSGLENFLSPANVRSIRETKVDKEVDRLIENGQATNKIIPQTAYKEDIQQKYGNKSFTINTHDLETFNRERGKYMQKKLSKLIESKRYQDSTDSDKAKLIKQMKDQANDVANEKLAKQKGLSTRDMLLEDSAYKEKEKKLVKLGLKKNNYAKVYKKYGDYRDEFKEKGTTKGKGMYITQILAGIEAKGGLRKLEQAKAAMNAGKENWTRAVNLYNKGIKAEELKKYALTDKQQDKLAYIKPNGEKSGIDKQKLYDYVNKKKLTQRQKWLMYEINRPDEGVIIIPRKSKGNPNPF